MVNNGKKSDKNINKKWNISPFALLEVGVVKDKNPSVPLMISEITSPGIRFLFLTSSKRAFNNFH